MDTSITVLSWQWATATIVFSLQIIQQSSSHHTTGTAAHSAYVQSHKRRMQSIKALHLVCMPIASWIWIRKLAKVFVSPYDLCTNCQIAIFILGHLHWILSCFFCLFVSYSRNQIDYPKRLFNTMWTDLGKTTWFYYRNNNILNKFNTIIYWISYWTENRFLHQNTIHKQIHINPICTHKWIKKKKKKHCSQWLLSSVNFLIYVSKHFQLCAGYF